MSENRLRKVISAFNTVVYPLTIASFGFIFYKSFVGDYSLIVSVAVAANLLALIVYGAFAKREYRVVSLLASVGVLATLSWVLYLLSMRQLLVLVLLLPYLFWSIYSIVSHFRAIRTHPHPA